MYRKQSGRVRPFSPDGRRDLATVEGQAHMYRTEVAWLKPKAHRPRSEFLRVAAPIVGFDLQTQDVDLVFTANWQVDHPHWCAAMFSR